MLPFDRFTERAQDVIARSQEILMRYSHNQMDTEHVFLALLEQPDGLAGQIFERFLGVNTELLALQLDEFLANNRRLNVPGRPGSGQIYVTPRIQRLGQVALSEAQTLSDEYISTEHILLAISSEDEAKRRDLPRRFVLNDDLLFDLATKRPKTAKDLAALKSYDARQADRYATELLRHLTVRGEVPAPTAALVPPDLRPDQKRRLEVLREVVAKEAERLGVIPAAR